MNPESPINDPQPKRNAGTESNKQSDHPQPEVTSGAAQSQTKPCQHGHKIACDKKRDWIDKTTLGLEGFGLFVLIVYTAATIVYAYLTYRMWGEMQQQTCIQRKASMNSERAWVGLDGPPAVEIGLLEDRKRMGATINFTVKDYGKGPALSVMASAAIVPSDASNQHVVEDSLESTCNLVSAFVGMKPTKPVYSSEPPTNRQWGHIIFPGQPFNTGTVTTIDMSKMIGKEVFIAGCIVYKDQFSEPHWTKFCYNTGAFAKDVVKDASSFKHLYMCGANNYTDEVEKKPSCPVTQPW